MVQVVLGLGGLITAGALRGVLWIILVNSVADREKVKHKLEHCSEVWGVAHHLASDFPVNEGFGLFRPASFLSDVLSEDRASLCFHQFPFQFVGDRAFWQVQLGSMGGKEGRY